jgi:hypothetical protein
MSAEFSLYRVDALSLENAERGDWSPDEDSTMGTPLFLDQSWICCRRSWRASARIQMQLHPIV